jgi:TPR repeat protein
MVVLLLGGMIHRVWFVGLKNDAPPQLAIETTARVSIGVAEQPQSASETTERADFSSSGLQAAPLQQLDDEQIAALIKVGRELIADGKIPLARLVLQRGASAGSAPAALELGGTYDPIILERLGVTAKTEMIESTVISPDTALARAWYQKAKDLGSVDAPGRLEKLTRRSGRPR